MNMHDELQRLKERRSGEPEYAVTVPQRQYRRLQQLALQQDVAVSDILPHIIDAGLRALRQNER